jgi:hypothetical protein
MQPTEQKIQTSAGMETATETVDRIKGQLGSTSTNVPVSAIENNAPAPLQFPEQPLSTINTGAAISSAENLTGNLQAQFTQEQEAEKAAAGLKESETDRRIRESVGILGTESTARTEMEKKAGIPEANKALRLLTTGLAQATASLREFDRFNANNLNAIEVEAGKRDITKRTFASMSREEQVKANVERANMVADIYAQQASIQVLQDDIKAATESIDKALNAFYEPKRQELQMEMMFFQRNAQRFDTASQNVVNAKMKEIEQQQKEIDRAVNLTNAAVATGAATAQEIHDMMSLGDNPKEQSLFASQILGRTAAEDRFMNQQMQQLQMANLRDQMAQRSRSYEQALQIAEAEDKEKRAAASEKSMEIMTLANELISDPGLRGAVGPNRLARIGGGLTGGDARFDAKAERLISLLTVDNLNLMSGVLSDSDIDILRSAGTALGTYRRIGWSAREKDVLSELNRLVSTSQRNVTNNGLTTEQAVFWGVISPEEAQSFEANWGIAIPAGEFNPGNYFTP